MIMGIGGLASLNNFPQIFTYSQGDGGPSHMIVGFCVPLKMLRS